MLFAERNKAMRRNFCSLSKLTGIRMRGLFVIWAATAITLSAQTPDTADDTNALAAPTFTTLYRFGGPDGGNPLGAPVQGLGGDLYGITYTGGLNNGGTVFKITPSGTLRTLFSFCSQSTCNDGEYPNGGLILATDGDFYGITDLSGGPTPYPCGTAFRITPRGKLTTISGICGYYAEAGALPLGPLVRAANGDFYGTTVLGGPSQEGTVFKITPSGVLTTLYSFCSQPQGGCTDGEDPRGGLIQATDGNLYGTTASGGLYGGGTVFQLTPSGFLTTIYSFCAQEWPCPDGQAPQGGLIQATDGNLYGTADGGLYGYGTVFKITTYGTLTTLYNFCAQGGACSDGSTPNPLIQATDGNLYGTTGGGGANNQGTVFKITRNGTLTTLYSFCSESGCADGDGPVGRLFQATDGAFYGTTSTGGIGTNCSGFYGATCGTIFRLSVGLGPFVRTLPTERRVGKDVKILGTDLTAATSVMFNGVPATFTVVSSTEIDTTVPVGATTGKVEVFLPSGTLSSNVRFRVLP
jgi:uncharacterized repeat protein (TIGR03803 family)